MENTIGPVLLVAFGAVLMVMNILKFFQFNRKAEEIGELHERKSRFLMRLYILLLIFFLGGYIFVGILFVFPILPVSQTMVGLIFFFGSVFVYLGLFLQIHLSDTVRKANMEIIGALVGTVEARDANLNGHSQHVAQLTMTLYRHLPKSERRELDADQLKYAAMLHDVGKLGIPESILNKPAPLSGEEWELMRRHPEIGENILNRVGYFKKTAIWTRYHHERYDGKGYFQMKEAEIPIPSRMISVVDTYSALTMERSYRKARSHEDAVEVLKECRGTQLDPHYVDLFLSIPKEEILKCMPKVNGMEESAPLLDQREKVC